MNCKVSLTVTGPNRKAVAERLREVIADESVSAFAKRCGLAEGLLRAYLSGSMPSLQKAAAIARAADVSVDWLATGEGPMLVSERCREQAQPTPSAASTGKAPMDEALMANVIATTEEWLIDQGYDVKPSGKARLFLAIYRIIVRKRAEIVDENIVNHRIRETIEDLIDSIF